MHKCSGYLPSEGYGDAIIECYEQNDGEYWTGNMEYGSQVAFCPYCGSQAPKAPGVRPLSATEHKPVTGSQL